VIKGFNYLRAQKPSPLEMSVRPIDVSQSDEWKALQAHYDSIGSKLKMTDLFAADPARFDAFRYCLGELFISELLNIQLVRAFQHNTRHRRALDPGGLL
jgi:hypothetical protein